MMPRTVLFGNSAMVRVLYSYARRCMHIAGFTVVDASLGNGETRFLRLPLVSFSRDRDVFEPSRHAMIIAIGYLEMNAPRHRKSLQVKELGYPLSSYVHDSVMLYDDVVIEENRIILDHVSIHPGSRIGQGTFMSGNVNIGHDCQIGAFNWINAGVTIAGGCQVGDGCFFGVNASTSHGLRVGHRTFIGAHDLAGTIIKCNTLVRCCDGNELRATEC